MYSSHPTERYSDNITSAQLVQNDEPKFTEETLLPKIPYTISACNQEIYAIIEGGSGTLMEPRYTNYRCPLGYHPVKYIVAPSIGPFNLGHSNSIQPCMIAFFPQLLSR